ncbi:predicted protein [Uncinocarpus reesii 1704]|uniref:Uncharacterized protein n=1 Tax=Uncinocarpus reesii (strain UAMH 1704) TaxID=336963 RepID=C4JPV8_UNCRE|nr:uncharacterized protein UREG_04601 [Uncinocarpus reesii 1704]EEP79755.1 predicted protein [Uncinocarpus reesii 1704]
MTAQGAPSGSPESALDSSKILSLAASCVDKDAPNVRTPWEAIALVGHACMVAVDFRLIGLKEGQTIVEDEPTTVLPSNWNDSGVYSFKYAHRQSAMQFLLKIIQIGNNAVISALALGHDKTASFDITIRDYISLSALPLAPSSDLADSLRRVFISPERLNDLISLFRINVIQKLVPGLQKEGYEDSFTTSQNRQEAENQRPTRDPLRDDRFPPPAQPHPFHDPLAAPPRRPIPAGDFPPPGFEDEYEINVPPRGYNPEAPYGGERRPLNIGERDLYPPGLGPHDPLRPHFGPSGGGGGMHPTFDDPLFGGTGGQPGPYDPQVPPGARYDPVGPGDGRPFGRGAGRGGGFGPGGGNPFGGGLGGGFGGDII